MPTRFDLRLRRYTPGGDLDEDSPNLVAQTIRATFPLGDVSGCQVQVSEAVYGTLPSVLEFALEYWNPDAGDEGEWIEAPDARFFAKEDGVDDKDPAGAHNLTGVNLIHWLLGKNALAAAGELANGYRPFNSATPGAIMTTVFDEAQARGWATYLTRDFDADVDSNGDPWAVVLTLQYRPGTSARLILRNLLDQGVIEARTEGRTLRLFNAGNGIHHDTGDNPIQIARTATTLPIKRTADDLATHLSFYGDNGLTLDLTNTGALADLGRLEVAIQQGGVSDPGTATLLGQAELDRGKQIREQYTSEEPAPAALYLPFIHHLLGDWVQAWIKNGWEPVRVAEIVLARQQSGLVTVARVLNDRFIELTARLARRTAGIIGGAVAGGTGAVPNTGDDDRQPKAPTGVTVDSTGYWDAGTSRAQVAIGWTPVTEATNDVAISVAGYEIWGRPDDGATPSNVVTYVEDTDATASPYEPGTNWLFKVRAQSANGVWGLFSDEEPVSMADAELALDQPTAPTAISVRGVIVYSWDGRFDTDPPTLAPAFLREVRVEISGTSAGDYVPVGTLTVAGQQGVIPGYPIGTTQWLRLVPVDRLGQDGPPSDPSPVTVVGIDGADLMFNSLDGNRIKVGSIVAALVSSDFGQQLQLSSNEAIEFLVGQVEEIFDGLDDTNADLADLRLYVRISGSEMTLSRPGSDTVIALSNSRIEVRQNGIAVSYWEASQMFVPNLVATTARIAGVKMEALGSGTAFKYVGV